MEMIGSKGYKKTRLKVIKTLKKYSGQLIEPKYTKNISSNSIKKKIYENLRPNLRISILKRLIDSKKFIRVIEAHNPISALIGEKTNYKKEIKSESLTLFGLQVLLIR